MSNHVTISGVDTGSGDGSINVTNGAAKVSDAANPQGIVRTRWISVATDTLPVVATSGVASFASPGVKGIVISAVRIVSGTPPINATTTNYTVRYSVDAANDAADAVLLPTTFPSSSATTNVGQIGAFNVTPVFIPDTEAAGDLRISQIILEKPVYIDVTDPITRLGLAHNIGGTVVLQFLISAVEEV